MKRILAGTALAAIVAVGGFAGTANAAPTNPGCFGQDRAAYIHDVFQADGTDPGASEWGTIAGERADTNGAQNAAYRLGCGGVPA